MTGQDRTGSDAAGPGGTLYGIGVGPGDPELMTLKAVRLIRACDVVLVPGEAVEDSVAYGIALQAVPELAGKRCEAVPMPMIRDPELLKASHGRAAEQVAALLDEGLNVGFLNLGDVTVYASYLYIHRRIMDQGYRAVLVNGIPSFCAAAAAMGEGLAEGSEQIHILPGPGQVEAGLKLPGTKVIMKAGKGMEFVKDQVVKAGAKAVLVERCGMPGQRILRDVGQIQGQESYYSLLIVKDKTDGGHGHEE